MPTPLQESLTYLHSIHSAPVEAGVILGTGLGGLVREMEIEHTIPYSDIPHFPLSTVEGHKGRLLFGTIDERRVVVMQGRFHLYEGYTPQQIAHPVRVMKLLGATTLFVSNVLNPQS